MCGIAGIWHDEASGNIGQRIKAMSDCLQHRGPDADGMLLANMREGRPVARMGDSTPADLAIGHRRLSVLDIVGGEQPMSNEDGSIWTVFNGEIYNFTELKQRLNARGHVFRSDHSDTETLVHGYEEWGDDLPLHLRGMFSFAVVDLRRRRVLLARDRFGKKPLYMTRFPGGFAFASELKALRRLPSVSCTIDPVAIEQYLASGYIPAPRTIFNGVEKLEQAHAAVIENCDVVRRWRYWNPSWEVRAEPEAQVLENVERLLRESVRIRLVSDVPLGALLSGGVDSSLVVALMQQESSRRVQTFTASFDGASTDERQYAASVAAHLGTEHVELNVTAEVAELLPRLVAHFDEPFGDSSMIPTYLVASLARQHVTVVLTGDGGDEIFGGYHHYVWFPHVARVRRIPGVRGMARLLGRTLPRRVTWRGRDAATLLGAPLGTAYSEVLAMASMAQRERIYGRALRKALTVSPRDEFAAAYATIEEPGLPLVSRMQRIDALLAFQPGDILTKVDRATMAVSLEARSPLLDHVLAEYAAGIDPALKLKGGVGKYLLKKIAERHIPPVLLHRRKMGFSVPLAEWLGNELRPFVDEILFEPDAAIDEWIDREELKRITTRGRMRGHYGAASLLYLCLCLELWLRQDVPVIT
jgi:asparagine synthase (glutamine-hydrolysing)